MTRDQFFAKYVFERELVGGATRTYMGRDAQGQPVMIHWTEGGPASLQGLRATLDYLSPAKHAQIIEWQHMDGVIAIVTPHIPHFVSFQQWIDEPPAGGAPPPVVGGGGGAEEGGFTQMFMEGSNPPASGPGVPPPPSAPSPPSVPDAPGSFTQFFDPSAPPPGGSPGPSVPQPPAPPAYGSPPGQPPIHSPAQPPLRPPGPPMPPARPPGVPGGGSPLQPPVPGAQPPVQPPQPPRGPTGAPVVSRPEGDGPSTMPFLGLPGSMPAQPGAGTPRPQPAPSESEGGFTQMFRDSLDAEDKQEAEAAERARQDAARGGDYLGRLDAPSPFVEAPPPAPQPGAPLPPSDPAGFTTTEVPSPKAGDGDLPGPYTQIVRGNPMQAAGGAAPGHSVGASSTGGKATPATGGGKPKVLIAALVVLVILSAVVLYFAFTAS